MNLLAGAFCGMTVDTILFPLDTIKTYKYFLVYNDIVDFKQDRELLLYPNINNYSKDWEPI